MTLFDKIKNKYNVAEDKNVPQFVYGPPNFKVEQDKKLVFNAFHGGYSEPSHYYYVRKNINTNEYEFKYGYSKHGARIFENATGENIKAIPRTEQEYKDFINELTDVVKNWNKQYLNSDIMDGTQWNINSLENNIEYGGSNDFPTDYKNAMQIINKYFGVENPDKYNVPPKDNIPQRVYGVPDSMNKKYDIQPEKNIPQKVYGIPDGMNKYNVDPEDNVPREVYGIPSPIRKNLREQNWDGRDEKIKIKITDNVSNFIILLTNTVTDCSFIFVEGDLENNFIGDVSLKMPKVEFIDYSKRLLEITKDWLPSMNQTNNRKKANEDLEWLVDIDIKSEGVNFSGKGEVPTNWNEFVDLISELEIIFKTMKERENKRLKADEQRNNLDNLICEKIKDPFFRDLVREYFKNNFESEVVAKKCFEDVAKYDDILNEFTLYLVQKNYDYPTKFTVEGYTAKDIHELNLSLKPTGVFSFMTSLRDEPEWAKDIIKKGFPNKDAIPPVTQKSSIMINEYYIDENGHEVDRQKNIDIDLNVLYSDLPSKIVKTANKADWKTFDMPEQKETFILDKNLTEEEIKILKKGHIPEVMEDKWFWYVESNKLYVHRSWTGFCIYIVELDTNGHLEVVVNRNIEQYKNTDVDEDKNTLSHLLDYWKTGKANYYDLFIEETYKAVLKQEEIVDKIVEEISNYPENKEFTLNQFMKNYDLGEGAKMQITQLIFDKLKEKNINISSQYKNAIVGLPYNIPYIKN